MPTSSARPEHLAGFALDLTARAARVDDQVDLVAQAFAHFRDTCPTIDAISSPEWQTRTTLGGARQLATSIAQIAQAFRAADGGPASPVARTDSLSLAQQLCDDFPGLVVGELAGPIHQESGRVAAAELRSTQGSERLRLLEELGASGQASSPSFALGFVGELGPDGLSEILSDIEQGYADVDVPLADADQVITLLSQLFAGAANAPGSPVDDDFIDAMAATRAGRNALRSLILGIGPIRTPVAVALGRALAMADRAIGDSETDLARNLLFDRTRLHDPDHAPNPDLAIIELLGRDPVASWEWENHAGPAVSPTALNLEAGRHDPRMIAALAPVTRAVLVDSVHRGLAAPYREVPLGDLPDPRSPTVRRTLPQIVELAGDSAYDPAMSKTLADIFATHPDYFREHAAGQIYDGGRDPVLVAYFAALARNRSALGAATDTSVAVFGAEADRVIEQSPPGRTVPSDLLGGVADAHAVARALEAGADRAGQHHNAAAGLAVALGSYAANRGAGAVAKEAGPAAPVVKIAAGAGIDAAEQKAIDTWVDTNDGRAEEVIVATDRAEPYLLAVALAGDPVWRGLLVDSSALVGLDVVRSARDRRAFTAWMERQPAPIRSLLIENLRAQRG